LCLKTLVNEINVHKVSTQLYKKLSATFFMNECHRQAEYLTVVGNMYCNSMNVIEEISSYVKMEVL
jgi:hypothetical protein